MRIAVNGWFHDQLATGSGQYLNALAECLPRIKSDHEFIIIRRCGEEATLRGNRGDGERRSGGEAQGLSTEYGIPQGRFAVRNTEHALRTIPVCTPFDRLNTNLAKLWFEQVTFPRACRRLRADVAFVPYWGSPWWQPCPMVVTVHDLIPLLLPLYRGGMLQRAYTALTSWTARRAAAVLTDSEASQRDIIARLGIPAERVHAIYLAADPALPACHRPRRVDAHPGEVRPARWTVLALSRRLRRVEECGADDRGVCADEIRSQETGVRGQESASLVSWSLVPDPWYLSPARSGYCRQAPRDRHRLQPRPATGGGAARGGRLRTLYRLGR